MRFEVVPACENTDFSFTYFWSPVVGVKNTALFHLTECMGNKSAMPRYKILPIKSALSALFPKVSQNAIAKSAEFVKVSQNRCSK